MANMDGEISITNDREPCTIFLTGHYNTITNSALLILSARLGYSLRLIRPAPTSRSDAVSSLLRLLYDYWAAQAVTELTLIE